MSFAKAKIFAHRQGRPFTSRNGTLCEVRDRLAFKVERLRTAYDGITKLKENLGIIDVDDPDLMAFEDLLSSSDEDDSMDMEVATLENQSDASSSESEADFTVNQQANIQKVRGSGEPSSVRNERKTKNRPGSERTIGEPSSTAGRQNALSMNSIPENDTAHSTSESEQIAGPSGLSPIPVRADQLMEGNGISSKSTVQKHDSGVKAVPSSARDLPENGNLDLIDEQFSGHHKYFLVRKTKTN